MLTIIIEIFLASLVGLFGTGMWLILFSKSTEAISNVSGILEICHVPCPFWLNEKYWDKIVIVIVAGFVISFILEAAWRVYSYCKVHSLTAQKLGNGRISSMLNWIGLILCLMGAGFFIVRLVVKPSAHISEVSPPLLGPPATTQNTAYLKPEEMTTKFYYVLFVDQKNKELTTGDVKQNLYAIRYAPMFDILPSIKKKEEFILFISAFAGTDLIERAIVRWMQFYFGGSWDFMPMEHLGASTRMGFADAGPERDNKKLISHDELRKVFSRNSLREHADFLRDGTLAAPPLCDITNYEKMDVTLHRIIELKNSHLDMVISIRSPLGANIGAPIHGVLENIDSGMRFFEYDFQITIDSKFKGFLPSESTRLESYKRWHTNISEALSEFDWPSIKKELDQHALERLTAQATKEPKDEQK